MAWVLQALIEAHDVTVLTWSPADLEGLNHYYGTTLNARSFRLKHAPWTLRAALQIDPGHRARLYPQAMLWRWARWLGRDHDIVFYALGECDIGANGLQYVTYPWLAGRVRRLRQLAEAQSMACRSRAVLELIRPWRLMSGFRVERMLAMRTLATSEWTAAILRREYGIDAPVLYPPVPGPFPVTEWEQRRLGFVCVGRFAPEKRIDMIVTILDRLRGLGHAVELTVIGTRVNSRNPAYDAELSQVFREHRSWVHVVEDLPRGEMLALIAEHRFGIHGHPCEHFGIAVAEMVKCGCIVFAPNDGGQVEILGGDARLLYDGVEDAVSRIDAVMRSDAIQRELRGRLNQVGAQFGVERFMDGLRAVVSEQISVDGREAA